MTLAAMVIEAPLVKEARPFAGLLSEIPVGWELCDGQNGKPDLRSRFILGAPAGQDPGATGGSNTHTHSDHGSQSHSGGTVGAISASTDAFAKGGTSASVKAASDIHTHPAPTFTQPSDHPGLAHEAGDNVPVYYTLAFITKPEWWL